MNVVALVGRLARPAELRELPSGDRLVSFQLTVECPGSKADSVPVVWVPAPASAADHDVGDEVVVVGRVRRRFFRRGATTDSRTEVVAEKIVPLRQVKRAQAALDSARARLAADRS